MPFVDNDGARLHWKLEGSASSNLVLLNSIGTDMSLWDEAMPYLLPHFRVLRIDTRGHGASDATDGDYSLSMLAGDVLSVMDAAGVQRAIVAGVSLGGMIAMELALSEPHRVVSLALICTSARVDASIWVARVTQVRHNGLQSVAGLSVGRFLSPSFAQHHPEVAADLCRKLMLMNPSGYAGAGAAIRDMTLLDRVGEITVPTTVVAGLRDISTPLDEHAAILAARISGSRLFVIDTAHLAPIEAPETVAGIILDTRSQNTTPRMTNEWSNDA
ncbi:3-oxoadipate enol-lactonase [Subtercola boreus]|uniref:3-oxoadipate enol-lactonase n=1 Tax=Subtercola boreus TaxID=120213 RepID=A0A3E0VBG7_9MICO|nr:alpha/beta fold hydrolase [Subtercola boreus]RFA07091.1 3-oxoadipate enol-lactonase [Subtercola boreus]